MTDYDEDFFDADLLHSAPSAFAPSVSADTTGSVMAPAVAARIAESRSKFVAPIAAPPAVDDVSEEKEKLDANGSPYGVLRLPPLDRDSFPIVGSNSVYRWVTLQADATPAGEVTGNDDDDDQLGAKSTRKRERNTEEEHERRTMRHQSMSTVNIQALLEKLEEIRAHEAVARHEARLAELKTQTSPQKNDGEDEDKIGSKRLRSSDADGGGGSRNATGSHHGVDDALWVVKYAPKAFHELLSDETINLRLLQWLKSWDDYVFGAAADTNNSSGAGGGATKEAKDPAPPEQRIVLVVGPPGVGKTTLAHVLAKHCGYEVVEVNASADRTVEKLESIISTSVLNMGGRRRGGAAARTVAPTATRPNPFNQSVGASPANENNRPAASTTLTGQQQPQPAPSSVLSSLLRPRCLIIDEMDGIQANVVQILLKQDIHRPVICLANNLYAPALKDLRQHVGVVFDVPAINPQRLLHRLEIVAAAEKIFASKPLLSELAEQSNGDVRCCLNTLQFLRRQAKSEVDMHRLVNQMKGKDSALGLWALWEDIFQKRDKRKYISALEQGLSSFAPNTNTNPGVKTSAGSGSSVDPGYAFINMTLQNCSDPDTLLDGIFEHYPAQRYTDFGFEKTLNHTDCFSFQDRLTTQAFQHQGLMSCAERMKLITAASSFVNCSSSYRMPRLTFPRESSNFKSKLRAGRSAVQLFAAQAPQPVAYTLLNRDDIALTTAPMLLRCVYPADLRIQPSNLSISSFLPKDQLLAKACTARHSLYKLTYKPKQDFSGSGMRRDSNGAAQERWCLDPPLDEIGGIRKPIGSNISKYNNSSWNNNNKARAVVEPKGAVAGSMINKPIPLLSLPEHAKQCIVGWCIEHNILQHAGSGTASAGKSGTTDAFFAKINEDIAMEKKALLLLSGQAAFVESPPVMEVVEKDISAPVKPEVERDAAVPPIDSQIKMERNMHGAAKPHVLSASAAAVGKAVKKDFFGRPIASAAAAVPAAPAAGVAELGVKPAAQGRPRTPPPMSMSGAVKYVYFDGATRAVKITAKLSDFAPL